MPGKGCFRHTKRSITRWQPTMKGMSKVAFSSHVLAGLTPGSNRQPTPTPFRSTCLTISSLRHGPEPRRCSVISSPKEAAWRRPPRNLGHVRTNCDTDTGRHSFEDAKTIVADALALLGQEYIASIGEGLMRWWTPWPTAESAAAPTAGVPTPPSLTCR